MNKKTLFFIRLFILLSFILTLISTKPSIYDALLYSSFMGAILYLLEKAFHRVSLLFFNTLVLALASGTLLGIVMLAILQKFLSFTLFQPPFKVLFFLQLSTFLTALYVALVMTIKGVSEIAFSIPFIRLQTTKAKKIFLDHSILSDPRLVDLASTGLLDGLLILPHFILKEVKEQSESKDETINSKGRLALEILKKLESMPDLGLKISEIDIHDVKEHPQKLMKLCKLHQGDLLTADLTKVESLQNDGVKIINLNSLASLLRPLMQRGEYLNIKIQRYGKEELQGIGYLEDGTMIVVNGGGAFIGQTIKASVLSVKHTSTGRIIFCNVAEGKLPINV